MSYSDLLASKTEETLSIVSSFLPKEEGYQKTVLEAMNYSFQAGGKRLRPLIMLETYRLFGGKGKVIEPFMAALEMIHNYSLVHDDLPEMDNDLLRRGKPTTHAVYGPGMAVLAGDGLLNYAFETAISAFDVAEEEERLWCIEALKILSKKAGIYGMIGGQTLDVEADEKELALSEEAIDFINAHKTAALLEAAFMIGGILAGAKSEEVQILETIGYDLGIAFQLQDDLLDVESTTEELGKPVGSDERNGKRTYLALKGKEETDKRQKALSKEAAEYMKSLYAKMGKEDLFLVSLIQELVMRRK
ncbi:MAG: polyprenyl synthetase family protein [Lachnospiraceae bacterium]|nr:polyprenyl synthetase family protein [Lachnospiraceae bacterium]